MNRARRPIHLALASILLLASTGCKPKASRAPGVYADTFYTVEEGRAVRMPAYRGEYPVLGQCVASGNYALEGKSCATLPGKPELRILEKQGYSMRSKLLSVDTGIAADVAGQKADATISVTTYRMLIEWNRYTVFSLDPKQAPEKVSQSYVSAVEYGIGVRIVLDVTLSKVGTKADMKFGLGTIAAYLDAGSASVSVKYDTIGVPYDILPPNLPTTIESVNDITQMAEALSGAVDRVSEDWNTIVEKAPSAQIGAVLNSDGTYDTGVFIDEPLSDADWAVIQPFVEAAKSLKNDPALVNDGIDLSGLDTLTQQTTGAQLEPVLEKLVVLRDYVRERESRKLAALVVGGAQIDLEKLDHAIEVLRKYYPHDPSWNGTLFPRSFSAAPIAYYVVRSETDLEKDKCNEQKLQHRALGKGGEFKDKDKDCENKQATGAGTPPKPDQAQPQRQSQPQSQ